MEYRKNVDEYTQPHWTVILGPLNMFHSASAYQFPSEMGAYRFARHHKTDASVMHRVVRSVEIQHPDGRVDRV